MSDPEAHHTSHSGDPHSRRPAGHDVSTSHTGNRGNQSLKSLGASGQEAVDSVGPTPPERSTPGNAHQTRSRGAPIPRSLGSTGKPAFDERLVVSTGGKQTTEGSREPVSHRDIIEPGFRVGSASAPSAGSKVHRLTGSATRADLTYAVQAAVGFTERHSRAEVTPIGPGTARRQSPPPIPPRVGKRAEEGGRTPDPSGEHHLTNPVNAPDGGVLDYVTPSSHKGGPHSPKTPIRPTVGGPTPISWEARNKERGRVEETSDQSTENEQVRGQLIPARLSFTDSEDLEVSVGRLAEDRTSSDADENAAGPAGEEREATPPAGEESNNDENDSGEDLGSQDDLEEVIGDNLDGESDHQGSDPDPSEHSNHPDSESEVSVDEDQPPAIMATAVKGPSIRLPWFYGKEDEQVEKYFRELKRLKIIYGWNDDNLLNMILLGLKDKADDWASALADDEKDTPEKLEDNMKKIFCDRRAPWQKHVDFCNLKQTKDQTIIEFAGTLKQRQAKCAASESTMLAVFLDGVKSSIARQVAIMDPKTFEEAVNSATRIESLDRGKTGSKISGAAAEVVENPDKGKEGLGDLVEKFGLVLARLETAPWQNRPPSTEAKSDPPQRGRGRGRPNQQSSGSDQNRAGGTVRSEPYNRGRGRGRGRGGRGNGRGSGEAKFAYDENKYCICHKTHGHSTDSCYWLVKTLKETQPPKTRAQKQNEETSKQEAGN